MKTNIIIGLCLALLQTGIAQNENTPADSSTISRTDSNLPPTTTENPTTTITESTPQPTTIEPSTERSTTVAQTTTIAPTTERSTTIEPSTERSTTLNPFPSAPSTPESKTKIVEKLSERIRSILKHFHEPESTGFPGQIILEDPMAVPNVTKDDAISTCHFYNLTIHGLSNFTVEAVNLFLDEMQVYVMIHMKKILVKGNLTLEAFMTTSKGPFNMILTNVTAEGTVSLKADSTGKLHAEKSSTEMFYERLEVASNASSLFQTVIDAAGMLLLQSTKPYILGQIEQRLNEEVNKQLESSPKFPTIVNRSPVDLAVIEGRKYVRKFYDPFTISNVMNHDSEYLNVKIGPVTLKGLSKFAKVGNITVQMKEGVVQLIARFVTGRLNGDCKFYYDFGKVGAPRNSTVKFSIDHLQFEAKLNQSVNLRNKPVLHDLEIEVGKIYVKLDGNGDFDFLVEMAVGLIPNMIRQLIIDEMERPIKEKLQSEILDKVNVEQLIEDNLSVMENYIIL